MILRFTSNSLVRCGLVRIIEEELIPVRIIDDQEAVAPPTTLDHNTLGREFRAQHIDCGNLDLGLEVQGNEYQPLANFLRPRVSQETRATVPSILSDTWPEKIGKGLIFISLN